MSDEQISRAKIKFNRYNGHENPIDIYKSDPDRINKQWLYWRNKNRYFEVGQIAICLVKIREDYWLLTTVDTVDKELGVVEGINYTGIPFEQYKAFYGRTIIKFHKSFQTQGVNFATIADELEVSLIGLLSHVSPGPKLSLPEQAPSTRAFDLNTIINKLVIKRGQYYEV